MDNDTSLENGRLFFADVIRAAAILLVLLFHSTNFYIDLFKMDQGGWLIANAARSLSYSCVPLFFMLSGLLLLNPEKSESIAVFFSKRFVRVLVPFLFWASVGLAYLMYIEGNIFSGFKILQMALNGPVFDHLWFVYILLGLYFATPVLRVYARHADKANLVYFLIVWFVGVGVLPLLDVYHLKVGIKLLVDTSFIGYFIAGYYLKNIRLNSLQIWIALFLFSAAFGFTVYMTYFLTAKAGGNLNQFYWQNTRPNVIIMAFSVFLILRSLPYEHYFRRFLFLKRMINYTAQISYGLYLVHYYLIVALFRGDFGFKIQTLGGSFLHPAIGISLTFLITTVLSFALVGILRRVPVVRAVVG